jgi:hypothetical protein
MGHPGIYKMEQAPKKKEHVGVKKRAFSSGHGSKFRGANFCKRWTLLGALWVFVNKKLVHHVRLWQLSAQNLVPYVTSGRTLNALNASWPQWHQKHTAFEDRFTLPFLITWTFMYQMGNSTYTHISNVKSTLVSIHDVQHMYIYIICLRHLDMLTRAHISPFSAWFWPGRRSHEVPIISWYIIIIRWGNLTTGRHRHNPPP